MAGAYLVLTEDTWLPAGSAAEMIGRKAFGDRFRFTMIRFPL